ncbi:hypothetical protein LEP1GSC133_2622 [Leptospira borgpetersenii serovar Pomona str. 200901868]|uniref:Uncharacterized protein n=1 Tax=Leptospira borgpetersenii serovar Pomona str. 200901868 TaxID=1192866 RepID=M6VU78_LEPBO|nr:hypothetical protein LEP1GSC133_2622 [Leptospira borgpetersenii serovar Pomona str. 200901868]
MSSFRESSHILEVLRPALRRILTEAAWQHRFPGTGSKIITARRSG